MNAMSQLQIMEERRCAESTGIRNMRQGSKVAVSASAPHMREVGSGGRRGGEKAHCVVRSARVVVARSGKSWWVM